MDLFPFSVVIVLYSATFWFKLAIIVAYLLAVRYLLGQPRTRRYRNTLLAALICLLSLDALGIAARFLPEGRGLPAPLAYLKELCIPVVILYVARRYRQTMSQEDGRPVRCIDLVFWLTLVMLVIVLTGLFLTFFLRNALSS